MKINTFGEFNKMEEDIAVKWDGMELQLRDFNTSHVNGGRLEKFWVVDRLSGRQFMIKANTPFGYEPISEKLAYIIGRDLGLDVLKYDIIPSELFAPFIGRKLFCKYYSICEKIDKQDCHITSIAEIKRALNIVKDADEAPIRNSDVMKQYLPKEYIDKMALFDAIIGNKDRHYGNVHLLRKLDGTFIPAPLLDNGASLLAITNPFFSFAYIVFHIKTRVINNYENESSSVYRSHDSMVEATTTLHNIPFNIPVKTIQIVNDIQDTLNYLPWYRRKMVERYVISRLHKYLGYIKKQRRDSVRLKENESKGEKEHT